uniref:CPBP family intramembrane glutamic endopeptidase n=1 Tax=Ndongobacter massiliensis TaxID=1871025 RepID=UPI000931F7A2|nr:CPBP family intramembrane glutamic endopeptidase [Ndongobacter massiliensis]
MLHKKVRAYLMLTFAITWLSWGLLALLVHCHLIPPDHLLYRLLHVLGGFGPTLAALFLLPQKMPRAILHYIFYGKKRRLGILFLLCLLQTFTLALSSRQWNPAIPWFIAPLIALMTIFVGGGNEELGWRGLLQPELEKSMSFFWATLLTGNLWMLWHLPLWWIPGASQQMMPFLFFYIFGLYLSFLLAVLYKTTKSVFYCMILHGFTNFLMSCFLFQGNILFVIGVLASISTCVWLLRREEKKPTRKRRKTGF